MTWGQAADGGDSSSVSAQLTNVRLVHGGPSVFGALKADGTVVTWGQASAGGDSSSVAAQLTNVEALYSCPRAFAAKKTDGTVVIWGAFSALWTNVLSLTSSQTWAFAGIKTDGTVVTAGPSGYGSNWGGNSGSVSAQLINVDKLVSTRRAFAALKADGTVVAWGALYGGDANAHFDLTDVVDLHSNERNFAFVFSNSSVLSWGTDGEHWLTVLGSAVRVKLRTDSI